MTAQSVLHNTLHTYCMWLNTWSHLDENPHIYEPEQFLTFDPDNKLYGTWAHVATISMGDDLWIFNITDGDDGGITELYVWIDESQGITHIAHCFDTSVQMIWADGKFLNTALGTIY